MRSDRKLFSCFGITSTRSAFAQPRLKGSEPPQFNGLDFACVGSEQQEKAGIKDSIELFVKDLNKAGKGFNYIEQSYRIAQNSKRAYEFVKARGVQYAEKLKHLGGHSVARSLETVGEGGACVQALNSHFESKGYFLF